jgi:predicted  nucleic acid-binding Zn-ribbon protein
MADLETTAGEAIIAVRQLENQIADANARLNQLREGPLDSIEEQCESVWGRLDQQVTGFLQGVEDVKGALHEFGRDGAGTIASVRTTLNEAYTVASSHLGEAASSIGNLRERIAGVEPQITTLQEGLEANAQELETELTRVETELEAAAEAARSFIGVEVPQALHRMQEELAQRAAAVKQAIAQECQAPVEAAEIDWSTKLVEVVGTVEQTFTAAGEHAQKVAAYSIWKCEEAFKETLGELQQAAEALEKSLGAFREEAEMAKTESTEATNTLDGSVQETIDALGSASSSIVNVLTELAKYSWGG